MQCIRTSLPSCLAALLLPASLMLVTDEVRWGVEDFLAAFILLMTMQAALRYALSSPSLRFGRLIGIALALGAIVFWVNAAVELF